jgi:hypothetical protein
VYRGEEVELKNEAAPQFDIGISSHIEQASQLTPVVLHNKLGMDSIA